MTYGVAPSLSKTTATSGFLRNLLLRGLAHTDNQPSLLNPERLQYLEPPLRGARQ
ncbi:hypothetical protein BgramDRAFT_6671 [Paraburkholderia graminis C4D1M]|uniref:Uncharacterized protein n=1 Tax=Paraburkholderia graminis (strain ATCC 700544 / DSM 17151 / LMG 18924 / NCIMB 13744 / C4D1M) TaxID=396598 RepID=B1GBD4_PARG4|nr:hypothetical protein BgramDRAFT_6671 [Paraburkholderia graminis C4D1M]